MLKYEKLIAIFIKEFPEVVNDYKEVIRSLEWEINQNLVYSFYESVVRVVFLDLVKNSSSSDFNEALLLKLLSFFEKMALSDDLEVKNALSIAIFEYITDDITILCKIAEMLKQNSKKIFEYSMNISYYNK